MFSTSMGPHPLVQNMAGFQIPSIPSFNYSNFGIYFGIDSTTDHPLPKSSQTNVVIKNLPPSVTKEMIEELLTSNPVKIQPSAILNLELSDVQNLKCSCKIKFERDVAYKVNLIHTWYLRVNNVPEMYLPESKILVEYPDTVVLECNDASILKLKEDLSVTAEESTFNAALETLKHWLTKGEVHKKNADGFSNLLFKIYEKVTLLNGTKMKSDTKIREEKQKLKSQMEGLHESLKNFKTVLDNASQKKVWDHFTKPQRKYLDTWSNEVEKMIEEFSQELLNEREEDEMDLEDSEKESAEIPDTETVPALKEELENKRKRKASLKEEYTAVKKRNIEELAQKKVIFDSMLRESEELQAKITAMNANEDDDNDNDIENPIVPANGLARSCEARAAEQQDNLSAEQVQQLGVLPLFLNLHTNGANIEYLTSFLRDRGHTISPEQVEVLLRRFPNMFAEETSGIGADIRSVWKYVRHTPPVD